MRLLFAAGLCTLAASLAACSSGTAGPTTTVTVPPSSSAAPSSGGAPGSSAAGNLSATNSGTPGAPTATATTLPGTCDSLLSDYYVSQALGGTQLAGKDAFVVGVPDAKIGRQSSINCRYGVVGTKAKVEIGISLYATTAQAATRINATVSDYTGHGATSTSATISTDQGSVTGNYLSGGTGDGYDLPLLVVAAGRRTVAVTVDSSAVKSPAPQQAATALAKLSLEKTAA